MAVVAPMAQSYNMYAVTLSFDFDTFIYYFIGHVRYMYVDLRSCCLLSSAQVFLHVG